MLEFARFVTRSPLYALKNWRGLSKTRKAMRLYKLNNPACEYCARSKKVEVHHNIPVSVDPLLAADPDNFTSLCRKPPCHQVVGHNGDFGGRYVENVKQICAQNVVVKVVK
ncbi:MAG: HNH endonuclease [Methylococcales bacterium]|nr:HNH endonuclease [Methylococcales bacterium]